MSPEAQGAAELLRRFDAGLSGEGVELELCVVGGAVLGFAFASEPSTRRPSALFASPDAALRARRRAAEKGRVAIDRLEDAARTSIVAGGGASAGFEGEHLKVLAPPPDYALAMKCAALHFTPDPSVEDDIRYLLRYMGLREAGDALDLVDAYLNPRQRPPDLESRLVAMLR